MCGVIEKETGSESQKIRPVSFEEALTLTRFGRFNVVLLLLSGVILTTVLLETLGISYVLPVADCDLKLTTKEKGAVSAIAFAGIITSSHLWGYLADTQGRRRVILPTLLLTFTCSFISSFCSNVWVFVVLRYLTGFLVSGPSATIYAYLGEFHNQKNRSRAIMGASVVFGIGCMSLPLIAWLVINQEWSFYIPVIDITYKPWRLFLVVCSSPSLLCGLVLLKFPESPKFVFSQGQKDETIQILSRIYAINSKDEDSNYPVVAIAEDPDVVNMRKSQPEVKGVLGLLRSMWNQTAPLFRAPYLQKTLIACTCQFGIFITSNGMYMWFPDILNRMTSFISSNPGQSATLCQVVNATLIDFKALEDHELISSDKCNQKLEISTYEHSLVLEILYAIGFAVMGLVINAVGKLPILVFVLAGCGICGIASVYVDIPLLGIYLYVILLVCGLAVTVVNAATVDLFPTSLRAMAVCISLMCGRLGSVVGSYLVGLFLEDYCEMTFIASGASLVACAILSFFIPNILKRAKTTTEADGIQNNVPRMSVTSISSRQ